MKAETLLHHMGRAITVLTMTLVCAATAHSVWAAQALPTKIAVFDFELEDGSAGASIAGNRDVDDALLRSISDEVRRTIAQSGLYQLVAISDADAQALQGQSLRTCNGCETEMAAALGADQSLTGVVRRITRTEYAVSFQVRDTKTGHVLAQRESDLRMGASDSWSRGAVSLIKTHLLDVSR